MTSLRVQSMAGGWATSKPRAKHSEAAQGGPMQGDLSPVHALSAHELA